MDIRKFLLVLVLCLCSGLAFAQDEITLISGDKIRAKVLEIRLETILYQQPDSLDSTTQTLAKKDVFMIRYANGTKEVFPQNLTPQSAANSEKTATPDQMYALGQQDALKYYKGNDALWGSAACATTLYGLIGSFVIGAVKPAVKPNRVSDINLIGDPNYYMGYQRTAHRKKKNKAAIGAGIGLATIPVITLMIISNSFN